MTVAASGVGALWYSRSPGPLDGRKFICATRLHEDVHKLGFPYNPNPNGNVFFYSVDLLVRGNCSRHIPMCRPNRTSERGGGGIPLEQLEKIRIAIGGAAFESLYQQCPAAAEGRVFKLRQHALIT